MIDFMQIALKEAKKSLRTDDVPVGAVIVEKGKIISKAHNTREKNNIVTKHAEINAIEKACRKKKNWYLNDCEIYITLEPCKMCMGAIEQSRIKKIYYATPREESSVIKVNKECNNIHSEEAKKMLKTFFKNKRK